MFTGLAHCYMLFPPCICMVVKLVAKLARYGVDLTLWNLNFISVSQFCTCALYSVLE